MLDIPHPNGDIGTDSGRKPFVEPRWHLGVGDHHGHANAGGLYGLQLGDQALNARRHVGGASELGEGRWREEVLQLLELQRRLVRRGAARHGRGVYGDGWVAAAAMIPAPHRTKSMKIVVMNHVTLGS